MDKPTIWRTNPNEVEPRIATDPHIKGEVHVRILSRTPTVLENTFPPNTWLGRHVHAADTLYIIKEGEFHIEGEGVFRPGDVRFVARSTDGGLAACGDAPALTTPNSCADAVSRCSSDRVGDESFAAEIDPGTASPKEAA